MFLSGVAFFASRDYVAFGASAAADNRNNVIHGQGTRGNLPAAIMADSGRATPLPPLACAQFPRPLAFVPDLFIADSNKKGSRIHCVVNRAMLTLPNGRAIADRAEAGAAISCIIGRGFQTRKEKGGRREWASTPLFQYSNLPWLLPVARSVIYDSL